MYKSGRTYYYLLKRPANRTRWTNFALQLERNWRSDFITIVLHFLNGTSNMYQIHDFKFISSGFFDILTAAEALPRNDYLMRVALLSNVPN
jgi:hypothetical protein